MSSIKFEPIDVSPIELQPFEEAQADAVAIFSALIAPRRLVDSAYLNELRAHNSDFEKQYQQRPGN